jgi:hypothetical protein
LRRQRRYRAVGRVGFAAGARGYCGKYGKPKNLYRPSHRYCACQLVCVCRSLIAAFRSAGVISLSKPFLASLNVLSPAKGPLEQARLIPAIRTSDAAATIGLNMSPIKGDEIVQPLSVWWHLRITGPVTHCRSQATRVAAPSGRSVLVIFQRIVLAMEWPN